ncbi:DinB family protein [Mucilaginibacter sp. L3T2-6]|uniref:DinB family protein n=1 Tax=Mucilaginibacter sp. L3T2-6 TaxID=3062491 RepID=UPI0026770D15|nr:DinB family protein [Mucilaginibacter sp. L3T2-6]MDO3642974.1 DinB family protein [Mucilaginibacter sp. L3T2-6]MDV6215299.1 DinB family protein [Mucilaginibacter sp. L3T2-6]
MMKANQELIKETNNTLDELIGLLDDIPAAQFNTVPFEGSWTAGQLAQHLTLANSGFPALATGPVAETDRAPDQMVAPIAESFLNFDTKFESPDFIRPEARDYDKDKMISGLKKIKADIAAEIGDLDLTKTCMAFAFPVLGNLTRYEAANFVIIHTTRHIHQLKNIYKVLNKK